MLAGADVFIGVSVPGAVTPAGIAQMAADPIVFALANPRSEVDPEEIEQIRRRDRDRPLRLSEPDQQRARVPRRLPRRARRSSARDHAARWSSQLRTRSRQAIPDDELASDYIVPSVFDRSVAPNVARAVAAAAVTAGVARDKQEVQR